MKVKFDRLRELNLVRPDGDSVLLTGMSDFHVLDIHELRETRQQLMIYAIGPDAAGDAEVHAATFAYARHNPVPVKLSPQEERDWAELLLRRAETMKRLRQMNSAAVLD